MKVKNLTLKCIILYMHSIFMASTLPVVIPLSALFAQTQPQTLAAIRNSIRVFHQILFILNLFSYRSQIRHVIEVIPKEQVLAFLTPFEPFKHIHFQIAFHASIIQSIQVPQSIATLVQTLPSRTQINYLTFLYSQYLYSTILLLLHLCTLLHLLLLNSDILFRLHFHRLHLHQQIIKIIHFLLLFLFFHLLFLDHLLWLFLHVHNVIHLIQQVIYVIILRFHYIFYKKCVSNFNIFSQLRPNLLSIPAKTILKSTNLLKNQNSKGFLLHLFIQRTHSHNKTQIQIDIPTLLVKIQELELLNAKLQKEVKSLKEINKYLLLSNQNKIDLIKNERKHKSYLILPTCDLTKQIRTEEDEVICYKSTANKELSQISSSPRRTQTIISSHKADLMSQIQLEETFKISSILDLQLIFTLNIHSQADEEAINMYKNDGNLKLLNELLQDEDYFIEVVQNSRHQKISFLFDKIKQLFNDHNQLFLIILRLKKIIQVRTIFQLAQGVLQMNQSLLLDDCLNEIVLKIMECLQCDRATCFLVDHSKNELWSRVAKGTSQIIRLPIGEGIAGCVAKNSKIINIRNAYMDDRFNKENDKKINYKTKTILACPIMEGQKCVGVLQCINKIDGVFNQNDEQLLKIISEQSAVVLENVINLRVQNIQYNKLNHIINVTDNIFI